MNDGDILEVEHALEHPVDRAAKGSVPDLNQVPAWLVEDLRVLVKKTGRISAVRYLAFYCTDRFGLFAPFVEDVVEGTADPATWRLDRPRR